MEVLTAGSAGRSGRQPGPAAIEEGEAFVSRELDHRPLAARDLIEVLHEVQRHFHYLPEPVLRAVARRLEVPLIEVFRVASFFKAFTLKPRGRHLITVCLGTACHVRGAGRLLETIQQALGVEAGQTSADGEYTVETVNCLGACAMGPVVVIDGRYHDHVSPPRLRPLLAALREEAPQEEKVAL